jgi:hypothetical protein
MRYRLRTLLLALAMLPAILAVVAPPLVQWLKRKSTIDMPVARVYPLAYADPQEAARMVKAALAGSTSAKIAIDPPSASLFVAGGTADHAVVAAVIKKLEQGKPASTPAERRQVKLKLHPAARARP